MSDVHDAGFLGQIAAPPNNPSIRKMTTKTELLIAVLGWVMIGVAIDLMPRDPQTRDTVAVHVALPGQQTAPRHSPKPGRGLHLIMAGRRHRGNQVIRDALPISA